MHINLYKYILRFLVNLTVCKLRRMHSILDCILKMNICYLKNKVLLYTRPTSSALIQPVCAFRTA